MLFLQINYYSSYLGVFSKAVTLSVKAFNYCSIPLMSDYNYVKVVETVTKDAFI
jgi:hypothetical protein